MTQPTDAVPLDQFDDVAVRVKDLQLDDEWRAWLYGHARTQGGLALAFRRMVLFHAVIALLRQSHESEQQLRVYLKDAGYDAAALRRVIARWRRGEPVPELAAVAPPVEVAPTPPPTATHTAPARRRKR